MAGDQPPPKPANDNAAPKQPANDNTGKSGPPGGGASGGDKPPPNPPPGGGADKTPTNQPPADKTAQPQQAQQDKGQQSQGDKGQQQQNQADKGRQVPGEAGPPANDNAARTGQPANDNAARSGQPAIDNSPRAGEPGGQQGGRGGAEAPAGVTAGAGGTKRAETAGAADQTKAADSAAARTGDAKPANDNARSTDAAKSTDAKAANDNSQNGRTDGSAQARVEQNAGHKNDSSTDRKGADKEAKQDKVGAAGGDSGALAATGASSADAKSTANMQGDKTAGGTTAAQDRAAAGAKAVGDEKARLESAGKLDEKTKTTLGAAQHDLTSAANRTGPGTDRSEALKQPNGTGKDAAIEGHKGPAEAAKPTESKTSPNGAAANPKSDVQKPGESNEKTDPFRNLTPEQKADCIRQYEKSVTESLEARRNDPRTAYLYPPGFDAKGGAPTWEAAIQRDYKDISVSQRLDRTTAYDMSPHWPHDGVDKNAAVRQNHQFEKDHTLNRIGDEGRGRFMSVGQTSDVNGKLADHNSNFSERALPGGHINSHYADYKVEKPFSADMTRAAPCFDRPGGGWQIDMATVRLTPDSKPGTTPTGEKITVEWMVKNDYLSRTYSTNPEQKVGA